MPDQSPRPDPVPGPPNPMLLRFRRIMKWMALASAIAAALAVAWLKWTSETMPWQMVLAAIAGVGLSVLLGTGLMGLVFVSSAGGHDDEATGGERRR